MEAFQKLEEDNDKLKKIISTREKALEDLSIKLQGDLMKKIEDQNKITTLEAELKQVRKKLDRANEALKEKVETKKKNQLAMF